MLQCSTGLRSFRFGCFLLLQRWRIVLADLWTDMILTTAYHLCRECSAVGRCHRARLLRFSLAGNRICTRWKWDVNSIHLKNSVSVQLIRLYLDCHQQHYHTMMCWMWLQSLCRCDRRFQFRRFCLLLVAMLMSLEHIMKKIICTSFHLFHPQHLTYLDILDLGIECGHTVRLSCKCIVVHGRAMDWPVCSMAFVWLWFFLCRRPVPISESSSTRPFGRI